MTPELFAIFAAISWGMQSVFIKKGLLTTTVTSGLTVNLFFSTITLWLFTFPFLQSISLNYEAIVFFVLGGVFGGFLGVFFLYEGINRLGAALTSTINGIYPLFASFFAIILIGEKITLLIFLGTLSIIFGVGMISGLGRGSQLKFKKLYLFIPILSALFWGLSTTIRKLGIDLLDSPILAAAIGTTTALTFLTLLLAFRGKISFPINERGSKYLVASGLIGSFSRVALISALALGEVTTVTPLVSTSPLFTLLFSRVFLKGIEKIDIFLVIGAIMIVAGSALVSIS